MEYVQQEVDVFEALSEAFPEIIKNKETKRDINNYLAEKHNIILGTFDEIMNNENQLQYLNEELLIVYLNAIYAATQNESVNPTRFFSEKDIKSALKFKYEIEKIEFPYTFENLMTRNSDGTFTGTISFKELAKLWNNGILKYNPDTQRAPKKKLMAKGIKKTPTVIGKSVKNITRLILNGKHVRTQLIFNILADGNDNFEFEDGELVIGEGTELDLIDGMHRLQGTLGALKINPNIDESYDLSIRNKRLNDARFELGIINHVNRFDKTLVKFNTDDSYGGLIVKDLISIPELKDRVETDKTTVSKALNMLTNYSVLSESVNISFDPQSAKEQYTITDFLKKFYGILISSYPEEFKTNMKKSRSLSWFNHHNMHCGFIYIAKLIYDKYNGSLDFPVNIISQLVEKINYTKGSGNELDKIMMEQGNRNSNQSKALIRKVFEKELSDMFSQEAN